MRDIELYIHDRFVGLKYRGEKMTVLPSFTTSVRALDFRYDASEQPTEICAQTDCVTLKRKYLYLPLEEVSTVTVQDDSRVIWDVRLSSTTFLYLDEIGYVVFLPDVYREFFVDERHGKTPVLKDSRQSMFTADVPFVLAGAQSALKRSLPDISLEVQQSDIPLFCFGEAGTVRDAFYSIGFSSVKGETALLSSGKDLRFRSVFTVYNESSQLDSHIEAVRRKKFSIEPIARVPVKRIPYTERPRFVFANAPWSSYNKKGIRAGSRWPHLRDVSEGDYLPFPFFMAYATSLLKKNGYAAQCIDAIAEDMSEEVFLDTLRVQGPDTVVLETSAASFYHDLSIAEKISAEGFYTILCGPFPYIYSEQFLRDHPSIDCVFIGEYEFTVLDFADTLRRNKPLQTVSGIIYREGETIRATPQRSLGDIDLLPWPERDSVPMARYIDTPGKIPVPSIQMLSSRGCPFRCDFCLWPQVLFQNTYRVRQVDDCVDEMQFFVEQKGYKSVYWDDDTFNVSEERTIRFADEIIRRSLHYVPWAMMARADSMTRPMLDRLKASGLAAIKYGVETMHACGQKVCRKDLPLPKTLEMIRYTKELGIKVHLTFVFGFDTDSHASIEQTITQALLLDPDSVQFSLLTPFPGTALYERLRQEDRIIAHDWSHYDGHHGCAFMPRQIKPQKLISLKEYAYRRWMDHQRKRRGVQGDLSRFMEYVRQHGMSYAVVKTLDYVKFLCFYRKDFIKKGV